MQNIDPILFLQPVLSLTIALAVLLYWWNRKGFRGVVLLLTPVAYFSAIAAKVVIQSFSLNKVLSTFGQESIGLGLYYGLQTAFLEVGLAYALARYGSKKRGLNRSDAVPFGISLALWENGILLGIIPLLNLGVVYLLLGSGSSTAQTAYSQLLTNNPDYFLPPAALLPGLLLGALERVSSMLVHIALGVLVVFAAVTGRKRLLLYAFPMGLIDALVPFASLNTYVFEAVVFFMSITFVAIAWRATAKPSTLGVASTSALTSKD